jgi:DNA modification methylase
VNIRDLRPDPKNLNRGTARGKEAVLSSIEAYGLGRAIVVDRDDQIIAGHTTAACAEAAGLDDAVVVETTGDQLVIVRRTDLSLSADDGRARGLGIADNRSSELGLNWDLKALGEQLKAVAVPTALFGDRELAAILSGVTEARQAAVEHAKHHAYSPPVAPMEETPLEYDERPQEGVARVQSGDLWQCAEHRLLCGDATSEKQVARLLVDEKPRLLITDPPYGVEYEPEWRDQAAAEGLIHSGAKRRGAVENDGAFNWAGAFALAPSAVAYVWHAGQSTVAAYQTLLEAGFLLRSQIVWVKDSFAISRGHYHWQHECCAYAVKNGETADWIGDRSQSTVWRMARRGTGELQTDHGTQKPVDCMRRPIHNHEGDVYDPFVGSGTTLLAAHLEGRRCFAMEISPRYCDMVLRRFESLTGETATLLDRRG